MIKVPATPAGIPAIEHLIGEGLSINVTLIFSLETYEQVANAYISGLEKLAAAGGDVSKIGSVASFFISRIDTLTDSIAEARLKTATRPRERTELQSLVGKVAIANAKLAYCRYKEICNADRWRALAHKGAQTQRLLWASTSTKNPTFRDVLYVEELIGAETVDTVPAATFTAFRDHGICRASLEEGIDEARDTMEMLGYVGISMEEVTQKLLDDGVGLFADAFDQLLSAVEEKREALLGTTLDRQTYTIGPYAETVEQTLEEWRQSGKVRRLWDADTSLWTGTDENQWLGWLHITEQQLEQCEPLRAIAQDVKQAGFKHALLMGMGGSSLCPEVMTLTFGQIDDYPQLHVLDSTVQDKVKTKRRGKKGKERKRKKKK
jgi:transaldolase/glucose-6-phosphate isomerase